MCFPPHIRQTNNTTFIFIILHIFSIINTFENIHKKVNNFLTFKSIQHLTHHLNFIFYLYLTIFSMYDINALIKLKGEFCQWLTDYIV